MSLSVLCCVWRCIYILVYILGIITLNFIELATPLTQKSLLFSTGITTAIPLSAFFRGFISVKICMHPMINLSCECFHLPTSASAEASWGFLSSQRQDFPFVSGTVIQLRSAQGLSYPLGYFQHPPSHRYLWIPPLTQPSGNKSPVCTRLQTAVSTLQTRLPRL